MSILYPIVSDSDVKNLDTYKYSGKDYSLASKYFMQAYWSAVVEFVPMHLAPNMLTLLGFACSTSTSMLLMYFSLFNEGVIPNWLWLYAAVSLFTYQTLDAIDGKQARRTQCGSPLGELFDHGCDALFTPLLCITICLSVDYTPVQSFVQCFFVSTGLFLSLFEQYSTGTLDLGYINGPVDGILITCVCFVMSSFWGPAWWSTEFATPLVNFGVHYGLDLAIRKPNDITFLFTVIAGTVTAMSNLMHAFTMPKAHNKIRRGSVLISQIAVSTLVAIVAAYCPNLLTGPFKFSLELAYGLLVSYTVSRMTVARLCKADYAPFTSPYRFTLLILVATLLFRVITDAPLPAFFSTIFAALSVFTGFSYLRMIVAVFLQFSTYLKINILTMTAAQHKNVDSIIAQQKTAKK